MSDRPPLNVRVDEDVRERFREFTRDKKGRVRGEMGRLVERAMEEYMDKDRLARVEERLTTIEQRQEKILALQDGDNGGATGQEDGYHAHTREEEKLESFNPGVRTRLKKTLENLPSERVRYSEFQQAVFDAGCTDTRTVDKYLEALKSQGILLPDPLDPGADDKWVRGPGVFAVVCEESDQISVDELNELFGRLEGQGRITEDEYRDAFPADADEKEEFLIDEISNLRDSLR